MTTIKHIFNNHWTLDMFRQGLYSNPSTDISMESQEVMFRYLDKPAQSSTPTGIRIWFIAVVSATLISGIYLFKKYG